MRTHGKGWTALYLALAGALSQACLCPLICQTVESAKRVRIGLGDSQLDDPLPGSAIQPVGAVQSAPVKKDATPPHRKGELLFAPIPISSEAIGIGLAPVAAYVFFPSASDRVSQPSTLAVAGVF